MLHPFALKKDAECKDYEYIFPFGEESGITAKMVFD
jgi:hypothetical protein